MSEEPPSPQDALREAIDGLESLSRDEMRRWLASSLRGEDSLLAHRAGDSAAYSVAAIYRHLSRFAKENLLEAAVSLVYDLAANRGWQGQAAEELLLLIQHLAPDEAKDILASLARSSQFQGLEEHQRYRVLQSLVSLGVRMSPAFWREALRQNASRFAGLAFDGLSLTSPDEAIALLPDLPDDQNASELRANALPGFIDDAGPAALPRIRRLLSTELPELPDAIRGEIVGFFEDEGQALDHPAGPESLDDKLPARLLEVCLYTLVEEDRETIGVSAQAAL